MSRENAGEKQDQRQEFQWVESKIDLLEGLEKPIQ